jgi:hypothetical protein
MKGTDGCNLRYTLSPMGATTAGSRSRLNPPSRLCRESRPPVKTRSSSKLPKQPITPGRRLLKFPLVKGKVLSEVEFSSNAEDHSITMVFSDKTMLHFNIEPGFTFFADYADLKTGDVRPLKRWKPVRSRLFRE